MEGNPANPSHSNSREACIRKIAAFLHAFEDGGELYTPAAESLLSMILAEKFVREFFVENEQSGARIEDAKTDTTTGFWAMANSLPEPLKLWRADHIQGKWRLVTLPRGTAKKPTKKRSRD